MKPDYFFFVKYHASGHGSIPENNEQSFNTSGVDLYQEVAKAEKKFQFI